MGCSQCRDGMVQESPIHALRPCPWCNATVDLTQPKPDLMLKEDHAPNPKDAIGRAKVAMSLVSPFAIAHEAHAMMDGARKYGPYNWRGKKVSAKIYLDAALRHVGDYLNRVDFASDSGAHSLGHARACLGIVLDALETGNLIDDRPAMADFAELLGRLNKKILEKGLHLPKEQK